MQSDVLEFKRICPKTGNLQTIPLKAGVISVFRASDTAEIDAWREVLEGRDKTLIEAHMGGLLLDLSSLNLIGFGESFEHERELKVIDLMRETKLSDDKIYSLLQRAGLDGMEELPCHELGPAQDRILRILVASHTSHAVVVFDEPFDPIPRIWRDRVAELLVEGIKERDSHVLVVSLSYRPSCWINNPCIERIQLDALRNLTIGCQQHIEDNRALVEKVRDELSSPLIPVPKFEEEKAIPVAPLPRVRKSFFRTSPFAAVATCALSSLFTIVGVLSFAPDLIGPRFLELPPLAVSELKPVADPPKAETVGLNSTLRAVLADQNSSIEDRYGEQLGQAITSAFEAPEVAPVEVAAVRVRREQSRGAAAFQPEGDSLTTYQQPSMTSSTSDTPQEPSSTTSLFEKRRKEIRRSFGVY